MIEDTGMEVTLYEYFRTYPETALHCGDEQATCAVKIRQQTHDAIYAVI